MNTYQSVTHNFDPVFNEDSRILILGTFPSVKSRETQFYYGHPQNRFWKLLALLFQTDCPNTIPEKKQFLLTHHVALWDVIASCEIIGSSDSSIRNVVPNDLSRILTLKPDLQIFANGNTAGKLYEKYQKPLTGKEIVILPSTSPANAAYSLDRLAEKWQECLISCCI